MGSALLVDSWSRTLRVTEGNPLRTRADAATSVRVAWTHGVANTRTVTIPVIWAKRRSRAMSTVIIGYPLLHCRTTSHRLTRPLAELGSPTSGAAPTAG